MSAAPAVPMEVACMEECYDKTQESYVNFSGKPRASDTIQSFSVALQGHGWHAFRRPGACNARTQPGHDLVRSNNCLNKLLNRQCTSDPRLPSNPLRPLATDSTRKF
eukprot:1167826-Pleurochrysis_carterae.AAC.1